VSENKVSRSLCASQRPHRASTRDRGRILFFFPVTRAIIDLVFFRITHYDDLAVQRFLALFDELRKAAADPVHFVKVGICSGFFCLRRGICKVEFRTRGR